MSSAISCRRRGHEFQQDGALSHQAKPTLSWLSKHRIKQFNEGAWPAQSPDMNPIEHLWPMIGHKLAGRVFRDIEDLWKALLKKTSPSTNCYQTAWPPSFSPKGVTRTTGVTQTYVVPQAPYVAGPCLAQGALCTLGVSPVGRPKFPPPEASQNSPPTL